VALAAVLALGPVWLLAFGHGAGAATGTARAGDGSLAAVARAGGCKLIEYEQLQRTDPTTGGRVRNERITAEPGSYVGRRPPTARGTLHALMHGAILVEYRPDAPPAEQAALGALADGPRSRTIVFANATMRPRIAATAYLNMLTCERADAGALRALRAFRDRRHDFGQGF
jgi:hypothetical protein